MKRLLGETCTEVSAPEEKQLTDQELANLHQSYRHILTRGVNELPPIAERPYGKRDRLAKSAAHNLWDRLKKYEAAVVLLFARVPDIAFSNNRAERDPRMSKVKRRFQVSSKLV